MMAHGSASATTKKEESSHDDAKTLKGVLFGRSIRSTYAILHLASEEESLANQHHDDPTSSSSRHHHVVVRLQFFGTSLSELRSWCRRLCKMGNLVQCQGTWRNAAGTNEENEDEILMYTTRRFVVNAQKDNFETILCVDQIAYWTMVQCQVWQQQYCPTTRSKQQSLTKSNTETNKDNKTTRTSKQSSSRSAYCHGGGIGKRQQADIVGKFLIQIMSQQAPHNQDGTVVFQQYCGSSSFIKQDFERKEAAITKLNEGTGVLDVAGGSGHVSMALGMAGIQSTVVDPRESVGKLPGRDRKIWNRATKKQQKTIPYNSIRAWFGPRPDGVDIVFRQQGEVVPSLSLQSQLLQECSAIVALHPDEATEQVVDMAISLQKPLVVVPCCVFGRLFPHLQTHNITTHRQFCTYLKAKHPSIQETKLPFDGANIALWSTFERKGHPKYCNR